VYSQLRTCIIDIGTVGFEMMFDDKKSEFELKIFESSIGFLKFLFKNNEIKVI